MEITKCSVYLTKFCTYKDLPSQNFNGECRKSKITIYSPKAWNILLTLNKSIGQIFDVFP